MRALIGFATACFVACGCFFGGCTDDDDRSPTRPPAPLFAEATTPDRLVLNFVSAHGERNIEEYADVLAEDFLYFFAPEDVDLSPSNQGYWERLRDVSATARMFAGQPGRLPNGDPQPAIETLELDLIAVDPDWIDGADDGPEYVGTSRRCYEVDATVSYVGSDLESRLLGRQCLYVVAVILDEGEDTERTVYRLRFWRDLGRPQDRIAAGTEGISWGELKARF
jgi:hypothetical protein